jgi:DNA mismatch endonuclease, patch repair protein
VVLSRRRVAGHLIVYDEPTSRRLARFGHEASGPEWLVRRYLTAAGLRFRTRNRDLPGSPDLANRSRRWAVFVHGCVWHHHASCPRATVPSRNRTFWLSKFRDNRRRDRRVLLQLERVGFTVVVIWECEVMQPRVLRQRLSKVVRALTSEQARRGAGGRRAGRPG